MMNIHGRIILAAVIAIFIVIFAFPPFQIVSNGIIINMGYSWILSPPTRNGIAAIVNTNMLLMELLGVILIGGAAFLLTTHYRISNKEKPAHVNQIEASPVLQSEALPFTTSQSPIGIGGWLLLLVILMMIISPLIGIGETSNAILETENEHPQLINLSEWRYYKTAFWIIVLISVCASFYGGLKLVTTKNKSTIKEVIILLWLSGPIGITMLFSLFGLSAESSDVTVANDYFKLLIKSVMVTTIWTLYLSHSKRVRNTYIDTAYNTPLTKNKTLSFRLLVSFAVIGYAGSLVSYAVFTKQKPHPTHTSQETEPSQQPKQQQLQTSPSTTASTFIDRHGNEIKYLRAEDLHIPQPTTALSQSQIIQNQLDALRTLPWRESNEELQSILDSFDELPEYFNTNTISYKGACAQGVRLFEDANSPPCRKGPRFDLVEKCYWISPNGRTVNPKAMGAIFNEMVQGPENINLTCWNLILKADTKAHAIFGNRLNR